MTHDDGLYTRVTALERKTDVHDAEIDALEKLVEKLGDGVNRLADSMDGLRIDLGNIGKDNATTVERSRWLELATIAIFGAVIGAACTHLF